MNPCEMLADNDTYAVVRHKILAPQGKNHPSKGDWILLAKLWGTTLENIKRIEKKYIKNLKKGLQNN